MSKLALAEDIDLSGRNSGMNQCSEILSGLRASNLLGCMEKLSRFRLACQSGTLS